MPTLLDDLARHAAERPGKPCVVTWEEGAYRVLSFADLLAEARRVAGALAGHAAGGVVFIVLKHSPMAYPVHVGAMLAGLIPSFLPFPTPKQDPALYFANHRVLFQRTPPAAVITYAGLMDPLREVLPPGTMLIDVETLDGPPAMPVTPVNDRVALLQHSSGTTGLKKGVALTFGQIAAQVAAYAPVAGLSERSVVVSWLPLYHDMGLFTGFLIPLSLGASVVALDAFEWVRQPALLLRSIEAFGGTHAWLPNFAFHHILATTEPADRFDLSSLQQLVSCSEPVKPDALRQFMARFAAMGAPADRMRACYAMAEACFAVTQSPAAPTALTFDRRSLLLGQQPVIALAGTDGPIIELVSNGPPVTGVEIGIGLEHGITMAATTAVGEIVLRGAFVFRAYHDAPELTEAAHRDGWYRTGDIGFRVGGELFICGRLKELIIVHGRNHYCHDIETAVSGVAGIVPGRVVAIGVEAPGAAGEELLLIAEPEGDDPAAHPALRRAVKTAVFTQLELMPRHVEFVPRGWLVKTTSGKLSRVENLTRLRERVPAVAP